MRTRRISQASTPSTSCDENSYVDATGIVAGGCVLVPIVAKLTPSPRAHSVRQRQDNAHDLRLRRDAELAVDSFYVCPHRVFLRSRLQDDIAHRVAFGQHYGHPALRQRQARV